MSSCFFTCQHHDSPPSICSLCIPSNSPAQSSAVVKCTAGWYCDNVVLTEPVAKCFGGYYCSEGSNVATQFMCPAGSFCPIGTNSTVPACTLGNYCALALLGADTPGLPFYSLGRGCVISFCLTGGFTIYLGDFSAHFSFSFLCRRKQFPIHVAVRFGPRIYSS